MAVSLKATGTQDTGQHCVERIGVVSRHVVNQQVTAIFHSAQQPRCEQQLPVLIERDPAQQVVFPIINGGGIDGGQRFVHRHCGDSLHQFMVGQAGRSGECGFLHLAQTPPQIGIGCPAAVQHRLIDKANTTHFSAQRFSVALWLSVKQIINTGNFARMHCCQVKHQRQRLRRKEPASCFVQPAVGNPDLLHKPMFFQV